ncbi:MAG: arginine repressor [Clostridia bacterium]|jgi:transcriptional regulator of arginine metabolism|nr:arginine repressor [Clostridia bacterium]
MKRAQRQSKILDLITKYDVETQEELAALLRDIGENVTQATVSRDIKELGLIKVASGNKYRYSYAEKHEPKLSVKMVNLFKESVVTIASSQNLIVIKTLAGTASAAASLIDKLGMIEILGTVAGDDTILVVINGEDNVSKVLDKFNQITK